MATGNTIFAAFFTIGNGKICRQFKQPTETSISRVNMNGKTVHEEFYDFIDGVITAIEAKESTYGKQWSITLMDSDETQVLQMNYSGGYAAAFLKTLPNVNLTEKVKIIPKLTIEGEKKKTTLFVSQHGQALKHYYTKDNPNGLPELKKIKIKGKPAWDDSDLMEFLEQMVYTKIIPQLKKTKPAITPVDEYEDEVKAEYEDEVKDDMPF